MAGTLVPVPRLQFLDGSGDPYASGKLYFFKAGTSTALTVYSDVELTTAHSQPIVLDASGRVEAGIYIMAVSCKMRLDTSADVTVFTQDDVPSTAVAAGGVGHPVYDFGGDRNYEYDNTGYETGSTLDKIIFNSTTWLIDSANLSGVFVLEAEVVSALAGMATFALVNLTDASDTAVTGSEASGTRSTTGERIRSGAITFATSGADKAYAVKVKTDDAAKPVSLWGARIIQTA